MPGMNAPKEAGPPRVSASVAGTVPATGPCVQSDRLVDWPLSSVTDLVSRTVPSGAVQVSVQLSFRNPRGPACSPSASKAGVGRTDGLTSHVNWPEAGTTIEDSRCVGIACGGEVVAGVVSFLIVAA